MDSLAYDAAKAAARFAKAKSAHDELIAAAHRAQVASPGGSGANQHGANVPGRNVSTVADLGLTRKAIHEARQLRDAEATAPSVIRRTRDARLAEGQEPTKAAVCGMRSVTCRPPRRQSLIGIPVRPASHDVGQYGLLHGHGLRAAYRVVGHRGERAMPGHETIARWRGTRHDGREPTRVRAGRPKLRVALKLILGGRDTPARNLFQQCHSWKKGSILILRVLIK